MATKAAITKKTTRKISKEPQQLIVKVTEDILKRLIDQNLDTQLQSDVKWCLGSYSHDKNPIGLYQAAEKALVIFKAEHAKKTKGFTKKVIADIEKALKER